MFSLLDLRFVLCSKDLYVLRAQRIMDFLSQLPANQRDQVIPSHCFSQIPIQTLIFSMLLSGSEFENSKYSHASDLFVWELLHISQYITRLLLELNLKGRLFIRSLFWTRSKGRFTRYDFVARNLLTTRKKVVGF